MNGTTAVDVFYAIDLQLNAKTNIKAGFLHIIGEMQTLSSFIDARLARGQGFFNRNDAMTALGLTEGAFHEAARRLQNKKKLVVIPKREFYLIVRPEDSVAGAPEASRWIDPLMRHLGIDYRIGLLRAAAHHGSSHQASMVFQVIVPKQLRSFSVGRNKVQFISQAPEEFKRCNIPELLDQLKTPAGLAKVAGVELTLLDCVRFFRRSGGLNLVAQIAGDLGNKVSPPKLSMAAEHYEQTIVRRLGYLLDHAGHHAAATVLEPHARKARRYVLLDSSVKSLSLDSAMPAQSEKVDKKWKLILNRPIEADDDDF